MDILSELLILLSVIYQEAVYRLFSSATHMTVIKVAIY